MDDMIALATIPIEMLQFLSLGPDLKGFFELVDTMSDALALDLDNIINVDGLVF